MGVGDVAAWFAAGIAIIAAVIAMSNANSAKTQAGAALKQAYEAKKAREAAEQQVESMKQQVVIMLDQLAEARADRNERTNAEQRQAVIDVLKTGQQWIDTLPPIIELCVTRDDPPMEESRRVVADFTQARAIYLSAVTTAKLGLAAGRLQMLIESLEYWVATWPIETVRIAGSMVGDDGQVDEAALLDAMSAKTQNRHALLVVQRLAEQHFTVVPGDVASASVDS